MSWDNIMPGGADDNRLEPVDCDCFEETDSGEADPHCSKCHGEGFYEPDPSDYEPLNDDVI